MIETQKTGPTFDMQIGRKAARKLRARRDPTGAVWPGLGMIGLVGWSVSVPTLLGVALGVWLDRRHPGTHSYTLALLVSGLAMGCVTAWYWISQEAKDMRDEEGDDG
jgi:ATP synthase protein I